MARFQNVAAWLENEPGLRKLGVQDAATGRAQDLSHEAGSLQEAVALRQDERVQDFRHDAVLGRHEERAVRPHEEHDRHHQHAAPKGQRPGQLGLAARQAREQEAGKGQGHHADLGHLPEDQRSPLAVFVREHARQRREEQERRDEAGRHDGNDRLVVNMTQAKIADEHVARVENGDDMDRLVIERSQKLGQDQTDVAARFERGGGLKLHA